MKFILLIFITAGFKIARSPLLYARSYRLSIRLLILLHKTADKMLLVTHTPLKMPSLQVKYWMEMEKYLLFFKKYHR